MCASCPTRCAVRAPGIENAYSVPGFNHSILKIVCAIISTLKFCNISGSELQDERDAVTAALAQRQHGGAHQTWSAVPCAARARILGS
eukprot:6192620-Pleurochrysis_carterae.AAC.1